MGADVSSERGYTAGQAADFEKKYREMYGEDLSREELLERYRMEKLKADQRQRSTEQSRRASNDEHYKSRYKDDHQSRSERKSGHRDRDGRYDSRRRQEDNYKIVQSTYERSKRRDDRETHEDRDENRSRRSRKHDDDPRRERERRSHRKSSRERSKRSSSDSSTKENHQKRDSSRKMRSSDGRRSSDNKRDKTSSKRSGSADDTHKISRSRRREEDHSASNRRSGRKDRNESTSGDEKRQREKKDNTVKRAEKSSQKDSKATKVRSKKNKKSAKAQHYQSAPDITAADRQYGRGPWQRTHSYFDDFGQRPQSWVQELAHERNGAMPAPVMERQIIYSVPAGAPTKMVDGLGYPLRERSPGFQPVPYETYLMQKPSRPLSLDMSHPQPQFFSSPTSPMRSPNTSTKLPAGAVPAVGPRLRGQAPAPIIAAQPIIPERGYEVQAHLPSSASSTPQYHGESSSMPPTYRTPPHYASSTLPRSDAPTPKPRTKSPTKEQKFFSEASRKKSTSPKRLSQGKPHKSKITATSAREDFESLLAAEYDMSKMTYSGDEYTKEFPNAFPGNYRANQEIFVDDVIFRKQPEIKDEVGSLTDSDVTDEENVLTLGEELSANSVGYSSGYDLEIPEGFCFDSEGAETNPVNNRKTDGIKKKRGSSKTQQEPKVIRNTAKSVQANPKLTRSKPLVLAAIEPVSRPGTKRSTSDEKVTSQKMSTLERRGPKKKPIQGEKARAARKSSRDKSTSPERERIIYPTKAVLQKSDIQHDHRKRKNKRIQHPSKVDDGYEKIITPSRKWVQKPETKVMHDVGVGTKSIKHQKSTGVQTAKPKGSPAQPIYFLKPISSQEVFIEDSVASKSETDFSQTQESSAASSGSNRARSTTSVSRSSTASSEPQRTDLSSEPQHTEQSDVESVVQNFKRNSEFYASNNRHDPPSVASSVTSNGSEQPASLGPASMVLGVSESIQASSYTGKGGKVFCLTRARHESSSSVSRAHTEDGGKLEIGREQTSWDNGQVEPTVERPFTHYETPHQEYEHPQYGAPQNSEEYDPIDAHEVGKWVLDCYAQDQKLTTGRFHPAPGDYVTAVPNPRLTKQQAIEFEGSFDLESGEGESPRQAEKPTKVIPLTKEALSKHEGSTDDFQTTIVTPLSREALSKHKGSTDYFHQPESHVESSATELSTDIPSDLGVFQKELIKTRRKIQSTRQKSPEEEWNAEQYKARLKQWNNSPSSNVVLAEVCSVNDEDMDPLPPKIASKAIQPRSQTPPFSTQNEPSEHTDDTASQSTLTSESSNEEVPPNESVKRPTNVELIQPYVATYPQNYPATKPAMLQKSGTHQGGLNKDVGWRHVPRPSSATKVAAQPHPGEDWRIVGAPKRPPASRQPVTDINDNLQQDPFVPRAEMLRKSVDSALDAQPQHPPSRIEEAQNLQPLKIRSASLNSDTASCRSSIANPFNKMDQEEIISLVEKIPGKGSSAKTVSEEKELLEKLEKARQESKRESLEERTARILGIHRRASTDDEDESDDDSSPKEHPQAPSPPQPIATTSSHDSKKDMNTYMNNLLTGAADVSPASRKKFFLGEMAKHQQHVTSPLATTSTSSKPRGAPPPPPEKKETEKMRPPELSESSEEESSDEATITETFSVDVSDSVLEVNVDCKVKTEGQNRVQSTPPAEYKIPDNMDPKPRADPMSPRGGMMLSYQNNIYAETPGFHRQQQSFDSTESDESELAPPNKVQPKPHVPHRAQESPVPISATSPPLTDKEIDIVKDLVQNHSRSTSRDSIDMSPVPSGSSGKPQPPSSLAIHPDRLSPASTSSSRSWSPRELARDKIAKSIGFTLHTKKPEASPSHSKRQPQATAFSPDEYDIKILSADKKRETPPQQDNPTLDGDKGSLQNVMESIGLDPNESWLLSV